MDTNITLTNEEMHLAELYKRAILKSEAVIVHHFYATLNEDRRFFLPTGEG